MHIHASALDALTIIAYIIIFGAIWRTVAIKTADKPIGKAMAYVY